MVYIVFSDSNNQSAKTAAITSILIGPGSNTESEILTFPIGDNCIDDIIFKSRQLILLPENENFCEKSPSRCHSAFWRRTYGTFQNGVGDTYFIVIHPVDHGVECFGIIFWHLDNSVLGLHPLWLASSIEEMTRFAEDFLMGCELSLPLTFACDQSNGYVKRYSKDERLTWVEIERDRKWSYLKNLAFLYGGSSSFNDDFDVRHWRLSWWSWNGLECEVSSCDLARRLSNGFVDVCLMNVDGDWRWFVET